MGDQGIQSRFDSEKSDISQIYNDIQNFLNANPEAILPDGFYDWVIKTPEGNEIPEVILSRMDFEKLSNAIYNNTEVVEIFSESSNYPLVKFQLIEMFKKLPLKAQVIEIGSASGKLLDIPEIRKIIIDKEINLTLVETSSDLRAEVQKKIIGYKLQDRVEVIEFIPQDNQYFNAYIQVAVDFLGPEENLNLINNMLKEGSTAIILSYLYRPVDNRKFQKNDRSYIEAIEQLLKNMRFFPTSIYKIVKQDDNTARVFQSPIMSLIIRNMTGLAEMEKLQDSPVFNRGMEIMDLLINNTSNPKKYKWIENDLIEALRNFLKQNPNFKLEVGQFKFPGVLGAVLILTKIREQ